ATTTTLSAPLQTWASRHSRSQPFNLMFDRIVSSSWMSSRCTDSGSYHRIRPPPALSCSPSSGSVEHQRVHPDDNEGHTHRIVNTGETGRGQADTATDV